MGEVRGAARQIGCQEKGLELYVYATQRDFKPRPFTPGDDDPFKISSGQLWTKFSAVLDFVLCQASFGQSYFSAVWTLSCLIFMCVEAYHIISR